MEVYKIESRDFQNTQILNLKRKLKYAIGAIILVGIVLLAMIIFNAIYIPKQDTLIIELTKYKENMTIIY